MFDIIYNFIDLILPFQWLSHSFMKNALLAILIVTPLFGILSTMVVVTKCPSLLTHWDMELLLE